MRMLQLGLGVTMLVVLAYRPSTPERQQLASLGPGGGGMSDLMRKLVQKEKALGDTKGIAIDQQLEKAAEAHEEGSAAPSAPPSMALPLWPPSATSDAPTHSPTVELTLAPYHEGWFHPKGPLHNSPTTSTPSHIGYLRASNDVPASSDQTMVPTHVMHYRPLGELHNRPKQTLEPLAFHPVTRQPTPAPVFGTTHTPTVIEYIKPTNVIAENSEITTAPTHIAWLQNSHDKAASPPANPSVAPTHVQFLVPHGHYLSATNLMVTAEDAATAGGAENEAEAEFDRLDRARRSEAAAAGSLQTELLAVRQQWERLFDD